MSACACCRGGEEAAAVPPREAFSMAMQALAAASGALERRRSGEEEEEEEEDEEEEGGWETEAAAAERACGMMARSCVELARRGRDRRGRPLDAQRDADAEDEVREPPGTAARRFARGADDAGGRG